MIQSASSVASLRAVALVTLLIVGPLVHAQDFGDNSSATLTKKAWEALAAGNGEHVLAYTGKCRELYGAEAAKQQAALTEFAPAEKGHDAWALNDVGTCLFIEGQLHEKQGRPKEAIAAYRRLVDELKFCQCWDTKGWFWKPAEAATGRLKELDFDAKLD